MLRIHRAAVLGAGVMGATIAAHLANAGLEVFLFDLPTGDPDSGSMEDRSRIAREALKKLEKSKPPALFQKESLTHIKPGNFDDDMEKLQTCDWVIEVVVEDMAIKQKLFEKVIPNLGETTILSTNTSGLSVNKMAAGLPLNVQKNFLVTHFFNPPRYMRLLEIIPCSHSDSEIVNSLAHFIQHRLGKVIVNAKDTPNFIANRIGVFSVFNAIHHMIDMGLTVEMVDTIAGPPMGRPKSAVFRTADLVGLDTLLHIAENSEELLIQDECRELFHPPEFLKRMIDNQLLGNKSGAGFYKKVQEEGERKILYYDYQTEQYKPLEKPSYHSIRTAKPIENVTERVKTLLEGKDQGSLFAWKTLRDTLIYSFNRIPEISNDIVNIDLAMKWGFNWELGPFEYFDAIGVSNFVKRAEEDGVLIPEKLKKIKQFHKWELGEPFFYDFDRNQYRPVPGNQERINLEILKKTGGLVEKGVNSSILDLDHGVFGVEFHSKMNIITGDILQMIQKAIKLAEKRGVGLVIGNDGVSFSAGANLMLLATTIAEGEFDEIDRMIREFQKTTMAIKYSKIPVVVAPYHMTLGGGCELVLHADAVNAYAETYMGLVELGVGLLPAGGGTKELALRSIKLAERYHTDISPFLFEAFKNIALAKVSGSADELFTMGFLRYGDGVTMNRDDLIADAKKRVLALAASYRPSTPETGLKAPGRSVAASIKSQVWNMMMGGYATEYDFEIGSIIADVICGGDLQPGTMITEQYLLDLEREAFLKLCGKPKTSERIRHMLKEGKPLRN